MIDVSEKFLDVQLQVPLIFFCVILRSVKCFIGAFSFSAGIAVEYLFALEIKQRTSLVSIFPNTFGGWKGKYSNLST